MDLDEEIKSREEGEIDSESREKGDLPPCPPPHYSSHSSQVDNQTISLMLLCLKMIVT